MSSLDDPELVVRFWKPHGVMTAFTDRDGRENLGDHISVPDIYAAGRLDRDSEGLLVLTRSKRLRGLLMDPEVGHPRTYLVQVEGIPDPDAIAGLASGVDLKDGRTRPARAELLADEPTLPPRRVPIRVRKSIPDSWLRITLTEGRNRQIRRMTAAVGHPTLRLVRESIGPIGLEGLNPGHWEILTETSRESLWESVRRSGSTSRQGRGRHRQGRRSPD